jgi:UDP:flavonoid glycosyltransferase YjiC (YdhE family)
MSQALRCTGSVIPYKELTAEKLSQAIQMTINNPGLYNSAEKTGKKIRSENGVANACLLIEGLME